jgi:hypothetical protein
MLCFTAARWIHSFARIILTCASWHSARILKLSVTHCFALGRAGSPRQPSFLRRFQRYLRVSLKFHRCAAGHYPGRKDDRSRPQIPRGGTGHAPPLAKFQLECQMLRPHPIFTPGTTRF